MTDLEKVVHPWVLQYMTEFDIPSEAQTLLTFPMGDLQIELTYALEEGVTSQIPVALIPAGEANGFWSMINGFAQPQSA